MKKIIEAFYSLQFLFFFRIVGYIQYSDFFLADKNMQSDSEEKVL